MKIKHILFICLLILQGYALYAQTRIVEGTIKDPSDGSPLPGVSVTVKGTTIGVITDVNGHYSIEAPIGSTLVISYVGFMKREMLVNPEPPQKNDIKKEIVKKQEVKIFHHSIPDNPGKTLAPYFFVQSDNPEVDRMPLKSTSANVTVSGVIADVTVKQVYINEGKNTLEAIYIFPGSTRAAVYAMSMSIGNRKLFAKIKEKEQARVEYEQAKQEGKTATLLEQKRPNVFQMNVANILPGDTITVEMKYTEMLEYVKGVYEFSYPTVVGPRYSTTPDTEENKDEQWLANPYLKENKAPTYAFNLDVNINAGMPIKEIISSSHKVNVKYTGEKSAEIKLDASEIEGGNRDFILRYRLNGNKVESGLLLYKHGDENFFTLMMQPPKAVLPDLIPPREYVFIVDVSGSMSGFPLNISKELMRNLLSKLRETDKFNIILFAGGNSLYAKESVDATYSNIKDGISFIDHQQGGGATEIYPAFKRALDLPSIDGYARAFVALTDGYVSIERKLFSFISNHRNEANFFAFGIGTSVNRYLIEGIAAAGMGEPYMVSNEKEAKDMGSKFMESIEKPVLTHIGIEFNKLEAYDIQPENIADVFAERPIIVTGKYKGEQRGSITIRGISGDEYYTHTFRIDSSQNINNPALRYLWARTKIRYLDDYAKYYSGSDNSFVEKSNDEEVKNEVTKLGLKYNLLTQYTSFIAVDSLIRNTTGQITKVKQPLPLPQGVSNAAIGNGDLSLSSDFQRLDEVVVVGYGVQKKSCVTGAISTVQSEEIQSASSGSVSSALQGRIAGVVVIEPNGTPGAIASVKIRGNSSSNSTSPLYVVNGVVVTDINNLNVNDIDNIEVVKDAGTAAIYGAQGADGIIVVTTKSGKQGKLKVTLKTTFSMDQVSSLPLRQNQYAQGNPDGTNFGMPTDQNSSYSWGPKLNTLEFNGIPNEFDKNGFLVKKGTGNGVTAKSYDPYAFFKTGFSTENYISISKGRESNSIFGSLGYKYLSGIVPTAWSKQYTGSLIADKKIKQVKLKGSILFTNQDDNLMPRSSNMTGVMYGLVSTPPSFDLGNGKVATAAANDKSSYLLGNGYPRMFPTEAMNPYEWVNTIKAESQSRHLDGSGNISWNLFKSFQLDYGITYNMVENTNLTGRSHLDTESLYSKLADRKDKLTSLNHKLQIIFNNTLNDWSLNMTAGVELSNSKRTIDNLMDLDTMVNKYHFDLKRNLFNAFFNGNVSYKNTLNAQVGFSRQILTYTNESGKAYNAFKAGLNLKFLNLEFLRQIQFLSDGKISLVYGNSYREAPYFKDYGNFSSQTMNGNPALFLNRNELIYTSGVKPEHEEFESFNLSVNNKMNTLTFEASLYSKNVSDVIFSRENYSQIQVNELYNQGSTNNKGLELSLTYQQRIFDFRFKSSITASAHQGIYHGQSGMVLTSAPGSTVSIVGIDGKQMGLLYGTRYSRYSNGNIIVDDAGYPITEMGIIGNTNSKFVVNLNNSIGFQNWDFSFLLEWKKGGDIWNGTAKAMNYYGTSKESGDLRETTGFIFQGVKQDGTINTTPVDFANYSNGTSGNRWIRYNGGIDEDLVQDGSWIKLRQVGLTYNFKYRILQSHPVSLFSISFNAFNLFTVTKYKGVDPENSFTGAENGVGIDYFNMPKTRSYSLSLKMEF